MPFFADGRELDDWEPQDMARETAALLDRIANAVEHNEMSDEERAELVTLTRRAALAMRVWAQFGKWPQSGRKP